MRPGPFEHGARAAPWRHRRGRIGEEERDHAGIGEAFHLMTRHADVMRAADGRRGNAEFACDSGQQCHRLVHSRIGEAVLGVDSEQGRTRALNRWHRKTVDLADLRLRSVERHAQQAVAFQPFGFGAHQRVRDETRVLRTGTATL
jgi:hypothetical protein